MSVGLTFASRDGTCTVTCRITRMPPDSPACGARWSVPSERGVRGDMSSRSTVPATVTDIGAERSRLRTACLLHDGGWTDRLPGSGRRVQLGHDAPVCAPRCGLDPAVRSSVSRRRLGARSRFLPEVADFSCLYIGSGTTFCLRWRDLLRGNEKLTRCGYTVKRHIPCGMGSFSVLPDRQPGTGRQVMPVPRECSRSHKSVAFPLSIDTSAPVWYTVNKKGT